QRELLFKSTHVPTVYFSKAQKYANEIRQIDPDLMSEFGVDYNPKPVRLTGRVLPKPPQIGADRRDSYYRKSKSMPDWAFFSFDSRVRDGDMEQFTQRMMSTAKTKGLN